MGQVAINVGNFNTKVVQVTPALDTSAYASGDVLFDRNQMNLGGSQTLRGRIRGVNVLDKDDQGAAIDLYFLKADVTLGTANAAPSISDANAENILGYVSVTASKDLGGCRFGQAESSIPFDLFGSSIWVAAVVNGTPTHTAAGLVVWVVFEIEAKI